MKLDDAKIKEQYTLTTDIFIYGKATSLILCNS